jgi:hypothetical protein
MSDMTCLHGFRPGFVALVLTVCPWAACPILAQAPPTVVGDGCCEHTVTCYRPEWRERDEVTMVEKLCLRAEVTPQKYTVQVQVVPPPFVTKTREVERDQVCTRMVPVTCTDPCTGCTRTEYKPETFVQKVKTTVIELCPNDAPCTTKTEERTKTCTNVYIDCKQVPVVHKVRYCEMVPYQTTVKAPACPPACAPACP